MDSDICSSVLSKVDDQIERLQHLVSLVSVDKLNWTPPIPKAFSVSVLLGHMLDCLAGFCAVLYAANPEKLSHFLELKKLPINQPSDMTTASSLIKRYHDAIHEGFSLLKDSDLRRKIQTVFVPAGEPLMSLLLINYEHLASHKYQLFLYLRMLGHEVASKDLYHFSGQ